MEHEMFFTIGIPVYNSEKYLRDCIESVLAQGFRDFELVLIDDGSTDSSGAICDEYAAKDCRVVVHHQKNGGISKASNAVLDVCRGKYLFFLDNDDLMCEDALQNAFDCIAANNEPDLIQNHYYQIYLGRVFDCRYPYPGDDYFSCGKDERAARLYLDRCISPTLWSKFIKTDFMKEANVRFNPAFSGVQDLDVTIQLCRRAERIVYGDFYSIKWFHPREGSVTTLWRYDAYARFIGFYRYYIDAVNNWDMPDVMKKTLRDRLCITGRGSIFSLFSLPYEDAVKMILLEEKLLAKDYRHISKTARKQVPFVQKIVFAAFQLIGVERAGRLVHFYLNKVKRI